MLLSFSISFVILQSDNYLLGAESVFRRT